MWHCCLWQVYVCHVAVMLMAGVFVCHVAMMFMAGVCLPCGSDVDGKRLPCGSDVDNRCLFAM